MGSDGHTGCKHDGMNYLFIHTQIHIYIHVHVHIYIHTYIYKVHAKKIYKICIHTYFVKIETSLLLNIDILYRCIYIHICMIARLQENKDL